MGNHTYKLLSRIDFPVLVRVLSNYYYVFEYVVKKTTTKIYALIVLLIRVHSLRKKMQLIGIPVEETRGGILCFLESCNFLMENNQETYRWSTVLYLEKDPQVRMQDLFVFAEQNPILRQANCSLFYMISHTQPTSCSHP